MPHYKFMVLSNPSDPSREDEYNDWYQNQHLADLCAIDGITSARRFRFARTLREGNCYGYMAIYDIETDDIDGVLAELGSATGDGRVKMSDAIDTADTVALVFEEFGPEVSAVS